MVFTTIINDTVHVVAERILQPACLSVTGNFWGGLANYVSYCNGFYRIVEEICNQGWLEFLTILVVVNLFFLRNVRLLAALFAHSELYHTMFVVETFV